MTVTDQDLRAIAHLVGKARADWDEPGILAALGKIRDEHSVAGLTVRAMRATERRDQRTPAIIALPGQHCRMPDEPERTQTPPAIRHGEFRATDHIAALRETVRNANRPKETNHE